MRRLAAIVALLLLFGCDRKLAPVPSVGPSEWTIEGIVAEESGKSLSGVTVRLDRLQQRFLWSAPSTVLIAETRSLPDGSYSFSGQLDGTYFVHAEHQDHHVCGPSSSIDVRSSSVIRHSIQMTRKNCPIIL